MQQLWTMTLYDLRQRIRDRSVIVFAIVVPLALISVFNLVFGDTEEVELRPVTVVTVTPAGDDLAATIPEVLAQVDIPGLDITVEPGSATEARDRVESGDAHLGLVVPEGFGADVQAGRAVTLEAVQGDAREIESQIVLSVVDGVLQQFEAASVAAAAGARAGIPPEELAQVAEQAVSARPEYQLALGETSPEQLGTAGSLVAGQAGLFMLFTVGFGVLGLVVERETGTLARLRSMPMRPELIIAAKALVSFLMGVVATSILLGVGGLLFDASFGALLPVAVIVVCAVAAATTLMFVIARIARTSEQAGVAQSVVAMLLGIAGGAFFPIQAPGLLGELLDLNPVAAFTRGLGITAGGGGLTDIGTPVAVLLGFGLVMLVVSRLVPDRGAAS